METKKLLPFTVITSPDDIFKIWIQQPNYTGRIVCTCGFSLQKRMSFVDAINQLGYISVESVSIVDENMSHLELRMDKNGYLHRLIEDLPELMDKYLISN